MMVMKKPSRREFLKGGVAGVVGAVSLTANSQTKQPATGRRLYVGTYTRNGKSEGIYLYRMDAASGQLTKLHSINSVNPSYLALDRNRRHLYAVNEVDDFEGKSSGAVSSFRIDPRTGNLTFLNQQSSLGADPCYVSLDTTGRFLLIANYTGGNVSVLPIQRNGALGPATAHVQHEGSSVHENQKGPHAHCFLVDAANRYALAADLGVDKIFVYRFDAIKGKLNPAAAPWATLKPGAGPRHLAFHPRGRYLYAINELDSTLSAFAYDGNLGTLQQIQTLSTLPDNFSGHNDCADVHVSPSGNFLYGSNRGHDSIVVFSIDQGTGKLKYVEHVSTQGKTPRNFTLDPTGHWLLVANQNSDSVVSFRIDSATGRLQLVGQVAEIPSPVCLKFG
jgi:6-phosphogluconolactonase